MKLKQRQYKVLVVSSQPRFNESLEALIAERQHFEHEVLTGVNAARRRLLDRDFDIIIINAPLPDEDGVRLAVDRASGYCAVLLLVPNDYYGDVFERVCSHGVYMLPKPLSAQMLRQSLDWLEVTCERLGSIEQKSTSLENRMNEIKLVNRAKLLLISYHGLSEEEAHHRIEKMAMDRGVKKCVIAEEIIAMNDTGDNR
ncbi:response regulator receiver and ANTAR domain protein [Ruminococcus sp. YE71]|uniref:ANTAR domain-containing response regulator n=1 Tax=unclassified Ruminococcus TaxID=2608920 RepID=UPI00088A8FCA|nr:MULTISPECIES: ANTAR domain-containing protein [unclassified Ruminococcus]SDA29755.1 response regulator receiver and ANTAR domain protein [Ruminococcus sp. YE78]SFW48813.1 response regulator receiver and ANTAR domain protein [Ruminococcus sp. YE71]